MGISSPNKAYETACAIRAPDVQKNKHIIPYRRLKGKAQPGLFYGRRTRFFAGFRINKPVWRIMSAEVLSLEKRHERMPLLLLATLAVTALTLWMLWTLAAERTPFQPDQQAVLVSSSAGEAERNV